MSHRRKLWVLVVAAVCVFCAGAGCGDDNAQTAAEKPKVNVGASCGIDSDCGHYGACLGGGCVDRINCDEDSDCSSGAGERYVCDERRAQCVQCLTDESCLHGWDCINGACQAVPDCTNTLDCEEQQVCDREDGRGECVECIGNADCGAGGLCIEAACKTQCASDKNCRDLGQLCDLDLGYCVACFSDTDCPQDRYCSEGSCEPDVCAPGDLTCVGRAVGICNDSGSGYVATPCPDGQSCGIQDDGAVCMDWLCPPYTLGCDESRSHVLACADTGLTAESVVDCALDTEVCVDGACQAVICESNQRYCEANEVRRCNEFGNGYDVIEACGVRQACDPDLTECVNHECQPGVPACRNNKVVECDVNGSASVVEDCKEDACVRGVCLPIVCEPDKSWCDGEVALTCNSSGTGAKETPCSASQFCDDSLDVAYCRADVCLADTDVCQDNSVAHCLANGSGFAPNPVDCGDTKTCLNGACIDLLCEPNQTYCQDGSVYRCTASGTSLTLQQNCTDECDDSSGTATCVVCTPNNYYCEGLSIYRCLASGQGLSFIGTCSASTDCVSYVNTYECEPKVAPDGGL